MLIQGGGNLNSTLEKKKIEYITNERHYAIWIESEIYWTFRDTQKDRGSDMLVRIATIYYFNPICFSSLNVEEIYTQQVSCFEIWRSRPSIRYILWREAYKNTWYTRMCIAVKDLSNGKKFMEEQLFWGSHMGNSVKHEKQVSRSLSLCLWKFQDEISLRRKNVVLWGKFWDEIF